MHARTQAPAPRQRARTHTYNHRRQLMEAVLAQPSDLSTLAARFRTTARSLLSLNPDIAAAAITADGMVGSGLAVAAR